MLLNTSNGLRNVCLKIKAKARPLTLVVRHCRIQFSLGILVKNNGLHSCFSRNSANTRSAGFPTALPLSISDTLRASSTSQAASASSSRPWSSEWIANRAISARSWFVSISISSFNFSTVSLIHDSSVSAHPRRHYVKSNHSRTHSGQRLIGRDVHHTSILRRPEGGVAVKIDAVVMTLSQLPALRARHRGALPRRLRHEDRDHRSAGMMSGLDRRRPERSCQEHQSPTVLAMRWVLQGGHSRRPTAVCCLNRVCCDRRCCTEHLVINGWRRCVPRHAPRTDHDRPARSMPTVVDVPAHATRTPSHTTER